MDVIVVEKPFKLQISTTSQKKRFAKGRRAAHSVESNLRTLRMTIIMNPTNLPRLTTIISTVNRKIYNQIDQDLMIESMLVLPQWKWIRESRNMKQGIKQVDFIIGCLQQTARTRTLSMFVENESNLRFISTIHVSYEYAD